MESPSSEGLALPRWRISHASLGLRGYVQFTSPIRRYSDMLAHYQIKAYLRNETLPFTDKDLSLRLGEADDVLKERNKAARESDKYWVYEFFRRRAAHAEASGDAGAATFTFTPLNYLRDTGTVCVVVCEDVGAEVVTLVPTLDDNARRPIGVPFEARIAYACPIDGKIDVVAVSEVGEDGGDAGGDKENVPPPSENAKEHAEAL